MTESRVVRWFIDSRDRLQRADLDRGPRRKGSARERELSEAVAEFDKAQVAVRALLAKRGGPIYYRPTDTLILLYGRRPEELLVYGYLTDSTGRKLR